MKKACLVSLTALSPLFLASCDAHFGSKHFDLPWWAVALIIITSLSVSFAIVGYEISKNEYKCKECGKTFYPTKMQAAFSLHNGNERGFKCPHCGKRGFCIKQ